MAYYIDTLWNAVYMQYNYTELLNMFADMKISAIFVVWQVTLFQFTSLPTSKVLIIILLTSLHDLYILPTILTSLMYTYYYSQITKICTSKQYNIYTITIHKSMHTQ